jgi:hypothetical protein
VRAVHSYGVCEFDWYGLAYIGAITSSQSAALRSMRCNIAIGDIVCNDARDCIAAKIKKSSRARQAELPREFF